jgi:hypothetical protein
MSDTHKVDADGSVNVCRQSNNLRSILHAYEGLIFDGKQAFGVEILWFHQQYHRRVGGSALPFHVSKDKMNTDATSRKIELMLGIQNIHVCH